MLALVVVALVVEVEKVVGLVDVTDLVDVVEVVDTEDWVVVVGLIEELVVTVLPGGWNRKSGLLA
jgi:hypothetical protein